MSEPADRPSKNHRNNGIVEPEGPGPGEGWSCAHWRAAQRMMALRRVLAGPVDDSEREQLLKELAELEAELGID